MGIAWEAAVGCAVAMERKEEEVRGLRAEAWAMAVQLATVKASLWAHLRQLEESVAEARAREGSARAESRAARERAAVLEATVAGLEARQTASAALRHEGGWERMQAECQVLQVHDLIMVCGALSCTI